MIRERWAGASWVIELESTRRRDGKPLHHVHLIITTLRTCPKVLLRLVRQRWAIENKWHRPSATQLGEDAYSYTHRNGVKVLAHLGTMALNLLRWDGFRSNRADLMAVAHDNSRMLSWFGISAAETR